MHQDKKTRFISILSMLSIILFFPLKVAAFQSVERNNAEQIKENNLTVPTPSKTPLVIESQVKGSQEQPNVIYIMPWQGIATPIIVVGNKPKVTLPSFKPINPKVFKRQSAIFYNASIKNQKPKTKNQ